MARVCTHLHSQIANSQIKDRLQQTVNINKGQTTTDCEHK